MTAPEGFNGQWFPTRPRGFLAFLIGPLFGWLFFRKNGIGIADDGLYMRGFGLKVIPWDQVLSIERTRGAGAVVAAAGVYQVQTANHGTLSLPIGQAENPDAVIQALQARGKLPQLPG